MDWAGKVTVAEVTARKESSNACVAINPGSFLNVGDIMF